MLVLRECVLSCRHAGRAAAGAVSFTSDTTVNTRSKTNTNTNTDTSKETDSTSTNTNQLSTSGPATIPELAY